MAGIPEKMDWRDTLCMWAAALMLFGLGLFIITNRWEFGAIGLGIAFVARFVAEISAPSVLPQTTRQIKE
jgi:hypothetical protein